MVSRNGAFGILVGTAVGTLFLVPAHGSAQDPLSVSCADMVFTSRLEDLNRCAEQGHAVSQYNLGVRYASGRGVPKDDAGARVWMLPSWAADGAQINLRLTDGNGGGVTEDDAEEAVHWYRLAAEQGHTRAQLNLGAMYATGEGVPQDLVFAYMWSDFSAAQGNESAL